MTYGPGRTRPLDSGSGAPDVVMGILQDLRDKPLPEGTDIVEEAKRLDSIYRPQSLSTGYQPEWATHKMPDIPKPVSPAYPEDTLTEGVFPKWNMRDSISDFVGGVASPVRQGISNIISGFKAEPSVMDRRTWLASLTDEEFRQAVQNGQVPREDMGLTMLPWLERAKALGEANTRSATWNEAIGRAADVIAPQPGHEPTSTLGQMGYKALEMAPGVAANLAKWTLLGPAATVGLNALSGNEAAREQVYQAQRAQEKSVPEALGQANSFGWNMADTLVRAGTDAAVLWLLGRTTSPIAMGKPITQRLGDAGATSALSRAGEAGTNILGQLGSSQAPTVAGMVGNGPIPGLGWSPIMQKLGHIGAASGISGAGGAGANVIGKLWSGQDVDAGETLEAAGKSALVTGLMGLFNMILNRQQLIDQTRTYNTFKQRLSQHNNAVTKRGLTPVGRNFSMNDSAMQVHDAILSGRLSRAEALRMLTEAGYPEADVINILQGMATEPRMSGNGTGQGVADFARQYAESQGAPNALPQGGAPGMTRAETHNRNQNLWNIVQSGQQQQAAEGQRVAQGFMDRYGLGVMGKGAEAPKVQPKNPIEQVLPEAPVQQPPVQQAQAAEGQNMARLMLKNSLQRFTLENGNPISEGTEDDFVLKDGQRAWGHVTEKLSGGDKNIPVGDVYVKVGKPGKKGMGLLHAKGHEQDFINIKFNGAEDYLEHTLGNFNLILPVGDGKHFVAVDTNQPTSPSAVLAWHDEDGGYYDLITAYPSRRRTVNSQKKKIAAYREAHPCSGSGTGPVRCEHRYII